MPLRLTVVSCSLTVRTPKIKHSAAKSICHANWSSSASLTQSTQVSNLIRPDALCDRVFGLAVRPHATDQVARTFTVAGHRQDRCGETAHRRCHRTESSFFPSPRWMCISRRGGRAGKSRFRIYFVHVLESVRSWGRPLAEIARGGIAFREHNAVVRRGFE